MKLAIVTNIPAPYRIPIYNIIAREMSYDFLVIYCASLEPDRQWDLGQIEFSYVYLKESFVKRKNKFIHNNPDVIKELKKFNPDVVVTTGFNPTHLFSWAYTLCTKSRHAPMTDGWIHSEKGLSILHRIIRKIVYRTSTAFIGAGKGSLDLYRSYGIDGSDMFQSHLCIDNDKFRMAGLNQLRSYDLMYSGQIVEGKIPEFFVKVVKQVKSLRSSLNILVIGDGPQRVNFLHSLKALGVEITYAGFIAQRDLPQHYSRAKILLFTTRNDAWGIVANEALASGTPVITSPYAGVANDLVQNGVNGYVLELDHVLWSSRIIELLEDQNLLEKMRSNAVASVAEFNFENAAKGIIAAARHALSAKKMHSNQQNKHL